MMKPILANLPLKINRVIDMKKLTPCKRFASSFFFACCLLQPATYSYASEDITDYQRKAEAGDVKAQLILAISYTEGEGVAKDSKKAVFWYRKVAEQGSAVAQWKQLSKG